ncbi:hypothetical protein JNUCC0626_40330 [Lentzea sp. JNUCC 0626]|uniref:hypothetical protein n=1 Tax=Lentzea sp. JNUCC 0626 TaxID=3367513 RepID=UPI003749A2FF
MLDELAGLATHCWAGPAQQAQAAVTLTEAREALVWAVDEIAQLRDDLESGRRREREAS